jgi:hypothetical protein
VADQIWLKSDISTDDLAAHLYTILRNIIMPLPDHILLSCARRWQCLWKNMSMGQGDSFTVTARLPQVFQS